MLPRTYLSERFEYKTNWNRYGTRSMGLLFGGFATVSGDDELLYGEPYRDESWPSQYAERPVMIDGMYDDGERLAVFTWNNITVWPSWDLVVTWFDRATGRRLARAEINFQIPDHDYLMDGIVVMPVEHPRDDLLGTMTENIGQSSHGMNHYLDQLIVDQQGQIWGVHGGVTQAVMRGTLSVQSTVYVKHLGPLAPSPPRAYEPTAGQGALVDRTLGYAEENMPQVNYSPGTRANEALDAGGEAMAKKADEYEGAVAEGLRSRFIFDSEAAVQARVEEEFANQQVQHPEGDTFPNAQKYALLTFSYNPTYFSWDDTGYPRCMAILNEYEFLISGHGASKNGNIPAIVNGFNHARRGELLHTVWLPGMPLSLALEGPGSTRVWCLLADGGLVCVDYLTGEPFVYTWLPLPPLSGAYTHISWQADYDRVLVCTLLSGDAYLGGFPEAHNRWNTRISGYSTTSVPVRICTPIPLRPLRQGRPTPVWLRQVGSLGEPMSGLCTLTPGAGVTLDRALVPLADGDGRVMVTASVEGTVSLTASVQVAATQGDPRVWSPAASNNGEWIDTPDRSYVKDRMATLTTSTTFTVAAAPVAAETVPVFVSLTASNQMPNFGRLIHPTLGTLEYLHPPTEWQNIDGDVLVQPVWASVKTLSGTSNTLWAGSIRDVVCVERWRERGALRMTVGQLRTMLTFYQNPPDPAAAAVTWWPDYTSTLGFRVAMVSLTVGGDGVTLDWVSKQTPTGFVSDRDVELRLRILGRV